MNDGDPAHNTHLVINLPSLPNSMPKGCKDITKGSQVAVDCEAANPLRSGTRHIFLFGLDAAKIVAPDATNLTASIKINTATDNANLNTSSELFLPLSIEADVTVYGYLINISISLSIPSYEIHRKSKKANYFFAVTKEDEARNVKNKIDATVLIQVIKTLKCKCKGKLLIIFFRLKNMALVLCKR